MFLGVFADLRARWIIAKKILSCGKIHFMVCEISSSDFCHAREGEAGVKVGYFLPPLPSSLPCHLSTSLSQVQYFAVIITENVTLPFEYRREAKSKRRLIKLRECRSDTSPSAFLWRTCRDQSLAHNTTESRSSWPNILLQSLAQDSQYAVLPRFHINRLPDNWNWNKKIMCSLGDAIDSCWCG